MYTDFSAVYDRLTGDVDYPSRTDYLCNLFKHFDRMPTLLLDLACGTGGFCNEFAAKGIQVIGVDISEDMLCCAREKSAERGCSVLYLCQNACELDLYGTVDGAICCLDSLNHITDYSDLCTAIARVSLFLEPERLFIFDVNTLYKQQTVLADNTFVIEEEDVYCVWNNEYDKEKHLTRINLDFFCKEDDGKYSRLEDYIEERVYTDNELRQALNAAGLEILALYAEQTLEKPNKTTQRVVYVTRKGK